MHEELNSDRLGNTYDLIRVPGVGVAFLPYFQKLGINKKEDLIGRDAEELFSKLNEMTNQKIDENVLYAFRCAVYAVNTPPEQQDPKLLKWWNWKRDAS